MRIERGEDRGRREKTEDRSEDTRRPVRFSFFGLRSPVFGLLSSVFGLLLIAMFSEHTISAASDGPTDAGDARQVLASELEEGTLAQGRARDWPALVEQFAGIVRSGPCGGGSGGDYADARYYVDRAAPKEGSPASAVLSAAVDPFPGVAQCLTATNLAELGAGSHLIAPGTVVQVFALGTRGGGKVYVFNQSPAAGVVVQVTSAASGGGKYSGQILGGTSAAVASGNLAMPEGLGSSGAALILNEEEDGLSGHRLDVPCYAVGQIVGQSGGQAIVMIRGALGATAGATSLAGSGVGADSGSWSRATSATPVTVSLQTRTVWDSSGGVLYGYSRNLQFDARGQLAGVSSETQYVIDTPTACE